MARLAIDLAAPQYKALDPAIRDRVGHALHDLAVEDPMGEQYAYLQVADDIQRRIKAGEIKAKLPGERELAEEYGVAYTTVRHAMEVLRERGLIVTRHGRGTFVKPKNLPGLFVPKPTRDMACHHSYSV